MGDVHSFPLKTRKDAAKTSVGGKKPEPAAFQWVCRRCEHDIGVATSEVMVTILCPMVKGAKVVGGTKRKICAACHRRGVVTVV